MHDAPGLNPQHCISISPTINPSSTAIFYPLFPPEMCAGALLDTQISFICTCGNWKSLYRLQPLPHPHFVLKNIGIWAKPLRIIVSGGGHASSLNGLALGYCVQGQVWSLALKKKKKKNENSTSFLQTMFPCKRMISILSYHAVYNSWV